MPISSGARSKYGLKLNEFLRSKELAQPRHLSPSGKEISQAIYSLSNSRNVSCATFETILAMERSPACQHLGLLVSQVAIFPSCVNLLREYCYGEGRGVGFFFLPPPMRNWCNMDCIQLASWRELRCFMPSGHGLVCSDCKAIPNRSPWVLSPRNIGPTDQSNHMQNFGHSYWSTREWSTRGEPEKRDCLAPRMAYQSFGWPSNLLTANWRVYVCGCHISPRTNVVCSEGVFACGSMGSHSFPKMVWSASCDVEHSSPKLWAHRSFNLWNGRVSGYSISQVII
jgi:hypothetical protein